MTSLLNIHSKLPVVSHSLMTTDYECNAIHQYQCTVCFYYNKLTMLIAFAVQSESSFWLMDLISSFMNV